MESLSRKQKFTATPESGVINVAKGNGRGNTTASQPSRIARGRAVGIRGGEYTMKPIRMICALAVILSAVTEVRGQQVIVSGTGHFYQQIDLCEGRCTLDGVSVGSGFSFVLQYDSDSIWFYQNNNWLFKAPPNEFSVSTGPYQLKTTPCTADPFGVIQYRHLNHQTQLALPPVGVRVHRRRFPAFQVSGRPSAIPYNYLVQAMVQATRSRVESFPEHFRRYHSLLDQAFNFSWLWIAGYWVYFF